MPKLPEGTPPQTGVLLFPKLQAVVPSPCILFCGLLLAHLWTPFSPFCFVGANVSMLNPSYLKLCLALSLLPCNFHFECCVLLLSPNGIPD